jgi:hypothetical protein
MDVLIAKLVAIPSAFLLGSYNFTFSQNVMPHLIQQNPSVVTPVFVKIYYTGAATIAPVAMAAITSYGYLAYNSNVTNRKLYMTSAILMFGTLPLTQLVMGPGIQRLIEISKNEGLLAQNGMKEEVVKLLKTWTAQNYFRSSLHVTAGFLGIYAALS